MQYKYQGVDESGKAITGLIDAADRRSAIALLSQQGRFATLLTTLLPDQKPVEKTKTHKSASQFKGFESNRISSKDIVSMINQLRTALKAGLPLLHCLQVIREQQTRTSVGKMLDQLIHAVSTGSSLSEAMDRQPNVFSPLSRAMIRVGETGGILEQTTDQLWQLLRREEKIKTDIKNASAYPLIVLTVGLISVIVVVTWILPKIVMSLGVEFAALPLPTRLLLAISDFVKGQGWLLAVIMVLALVFWRWWLRTERGRFLWDRFKLKVPVLSKTLLAIAVGRFARTLGSLTTGGITILDALAVVRDTLGNALLAGELDKIADKVKTGESVAQALAESGRFPPLLVQITAVGEQSGKLDEMLLTAAETFDEEADAMITRFMALLPTLLILILAIIVAFIVLGTLLPIVGMELGPTGL